MSERIKCCPFCGSNEVEVAKTGPLWIECAKCGAQTRGHKTRKGAIAKWNLRDTPTATVVYDMSKD